MQPLAQFGPVGAVAPYVEYAVLALALVNVVTRRLAHERHVRQAREDGAEAVSRHLLHEGTNVLLVLGAFGMVLAEYHGGVVMSLLVVGLVLTDFFEFEARKVEARQDEPLDAPKGALVASALVVAYAAYQTLFFLVSDLWGAIV